jgi:2'-5' RNA ligase
MEKIIGIHFNIPKPTGNIILRATKHADIDYPGNYGYEPHITLYLCRFPAKNFHKLINQISKFEFQPINLKITKVSIQRENNGQAFLSLTFTENKQIKKLHRQILQLANKLRGDLIRLKDQQLIKQGAFSKKALDYLTKYGSQRVLSLYIPHITLGEVAWPKARTTAKKLNQFLPLLKKTPLTLSRLTVGLYNYDNKKTEYTKVIREEKIPL